MAIESACIPLPSEIIMPFSVISFRGEMNLVGRRSGRGWLRARIVGGLLGGMYGGRPFIEKYGRYILLSRHDLDIADRWFAKYGEVIVFVSRLLPAIRTFIAFPAGVARMNLTRFVIYTFAGSCRGVWGWRMRARSGRAVGQGRHVKDVVPSFRLSDRHRRGAFVAWWIWRHIKHSRPTAH